ncbi:unnamed protein product [Cyclocybe aegerita]|uniref:SprT-like domain-containing protein n=1 Tax=Cyclocybe aegerita TaxID=1973307 RepID=A0A8S0VX13_CYCAE|nr:unnamed protein product [Cyclocybe aegerita]
MITNNSKKTPVQLDSPRRVEPRHVEVIPDSEEERRERASSTKKHGEVIEISSDSDESDEDYRGMNGISSMGGTVQTPRRPLYSIRRIIESSGEEDSSEVDVIELTDDSDEEVVVQLHLPDPGSNATVPQERSQTPPHPYMPRVNDGVIVFDEPRNAKTPLRTSIKKKQAFVNTPTKGTKVPLNGDEDGPNIPNKNVATRITGPPASGARLTPATQRQAANVTPRTPRTTTKKAQKLAEQQRLRDYAQHLFTELNETVFDQGLPGDTKLNWSKRLLTTAGRARFHRSKEGVQSTEIELAEKILDCDERIRNTLSHEMCHLATWVIDDNFKEHHGKVFKKWAGMVMKEHPHIHVSIKHDYEISYPFEWKCEKCAKVYGRFTKSIRPDECVCGACKEGRLIPQFTTRSVKNTPKVSRLAAAKPQDSPRAVQDKERAGAAADSDSEDLVIEILTKTLASTSLVL